MQRTFKTRLKNLTPESIAALGGYASLHGIVKRSLFAALQSGRELKDIKRDFLVLFGITSRQFNAAEVSVRGLITAQKTTRALRIASLKRKIKRDEKVLSRKKKPLKPAAAHNKKRRRDSLKLELAKLEADTNPHICFGTKKLFRSQFNEGTDQKKWKQEWQESRNNQFYVVGSNDENAG